MFFRTPLGGRGAPQPLQAFIIRSKEKGTESESFETRLVGLGCSVESVSPDGTVSGIQLPHLPPYRDALRVVEGLPSDTAVLEELLGSEPDAVVLLVLAPHEKEAATPLLSRLNVEALVEPLAPGELASTLERVCARLRGVEALARAHEQTTLARALFQFAPDATLLTAPDGTIRQANSRALELFGYDEDEVVGKPVEMLMPERFRKRHVGYRQGFYAEPRMRKMGTGMELRGLRRDGSEFPLDISLGPVNAQESELVLCIIRDITDQKETEEFLKRAHDELEGMVAERTVELREANERLSHELEERKRAEKALAESEEQLRQAQRMEAVGRLAGGIAHDFNNLLTIIGANTQLALEEIFEEHPIYRDLETVLRACEKATGLTRQLLAFSRKQVLEPRVLDLNHLVTNTEKLLRRVIGEDVRVITQLRPDLGLVKADPGQLEQVVMNLVVNARDAMPGGGTLVIETQNAELDEGYSSKHFQVQPGSYIMLGVSDTGCGMDAETQSHIFEPFFTTKDLGKGTGLGLSTVYGIVKQSGGHVWVYSEIDRGTTFKIYLPRVVDQEARQTGRSGQAVEGGSETILLVEDATEVRELACRILTRRGYRVLDADSPETALRIVDEFSERIDLLLTDIVMPGMNGRELMNEVVSRRPGTRVLFMSGYTDDVIVYHGVNEPGTSFLQKPFSPDSLAQKVRSVIDGLPVAE